MSEKPDLKATVQEWIRYATGDLAVAEHELENVAPVYHTICFLCQGSAEKFLKAFLLSKGWPLIKTHDILMLLGECAVYDDQLPTLRAEGRLLNNTSLLADIPVTLVWRRLARPS